ncbi:hypothetical protein TSAR_005088 [Trichomalopsis sarcophagae]|uniref:Uncharacterized protein n=1 Tax=Trichomalopsis sarcophagae TaxID=543379 RepID=A0A232FMH9_9HYME|nr:hypothetical protein TSAR_005088 [Trichomalopsis sarcophagae]
MGTEQKSRFLEHHSQA